MRQRWLRNGYLITMNEGRHVYPRGDVLVEGDRIVAAGRVDPALVAPDAEVVDVRGKLVLPGLVNTHVHLSQQLARGLADDVDLLTWLRRRIWPYESSMTLEDSYISSLACCLELIRSGVTCFAEAGGQEVDGMGRAVREAGLRGVLSRSTMDSGDGLPAKWAESTDACLENQVRLLETWHGAADGRIRVWFNVRTIFNASDDLLVRTKQLADQYRVGIHMHVAEIEEENRYALATRGATTVRHLRRLGVLDRNLLAVHCVWLDEEELELFRQHDVKVSHNPAAALKVALGLPKIPEMLSRGICVSIGTDGAPSNNRMDLMSDMYLASLLQKGRMLDPQAMPAERMLEMATINGARCLGLDGEIGSLEPGKKADLIVLAADDVGALPMHDPIANFVYAMRSGNVVSSMVGGRWIMRDRVILGVDESAVLQEARVRAERLLERSGIALKPRFPILERHAMEG